MKKLRWILISVLIITVVLLFWCWRSPRLEEPPKGLPPAVSASSNIPQAIVPPSTAPATPVQVSSAGAAPQISKREQMQNLLGAVNHKAIEFYGKVLDQQGAPLANVDVYASVIYNSGLSAGLDKKQTRTNAEGLFSISGMKGRTLGIGLDKDGYEYGGDQGPFQFTEMVPEAERYHPDEKNPVLFRMWKLQGAEPLIYFERKTFILSPDGTPIKVNLATGKKVASGGDITVSLNHQLAPKGQWLHNYPWTAQVMAAGLIESADKLMYLAPETGYVSTLAYGEKGNERDYLGQVQRSFYLKTSDNRHARVKIDLHTQTSPDYPSSVVMTWWLNPTPGHRNLEFDPKKVVNPKP